MTTNKIELKSTKSIINQGYTILVYGEAGTGKTHDIQYLNNPIVISAEGGLLTLNDKDIPFVEVANWTDFLNALQYVFTEETLKDKTICIDSLSVLSDYCYMHYLKLNNDNQLKAYQMVSEKFPAVIEKLQKKQRNVYLISQLDVEKDDNGVIIKYRPLIKGKASSTKIPHIVDFIFCKKIVNSDGKLQRVLLTGLDNKHELKSRVKLAKNHYADISEVFNELNNINKE
jgi:hypothetical protein